MENKIKELIEKYNSDRIHDIALKEGVGVYDEIIKDLQSLLKLCQAQFEIKKVYERYKHLDIILSDPVSMNENDFEHAVCYDLWKAVKNENAKDKTE